MQPEPEQLLFLEAAYLDEGRLEEWLDLFTDDAWYWVPSGGGDGDPSSRLSLISDDRKHLEERVWRLTSTSAPSAFPAPKTCRVVSNLRAGEPGDDGVITVHSVFVLHELRRSRQTCWTGRYEHRLTVDGDGRLKILRKRVDLLNCDEALTNLAFIF